MILGTYFPKSFVTAVHIFPCSDQQITDMLLGIKDIDNARNGILMFKPLEYAFRRFLLSLIQVDDRNNVFTVKLFDLSLREKLLVDAIEDSNQRQAVIDSVPKGCEFNLQATFGDIEGKEICFDSPNNRPYRRCFNLQASLAYTKNAFENEQMNKKMNG
jgi:hypothetical protein